jgi:hypothetical protein
MSFLKDSVKAITPRLPDDDLDRVVTQLIAKGVEDPPDLQSVQEKWLHGFLKCRDCYLLGSQQVSFLASKSVINNIDINLFAVIIDAPISPEVQVCISGDIFRFALDGSTIFKLTGAGSTSNSSQQKNETCKEAPYTPYASLL